MKRYLIYGFLTILIITLNFAFVIVLASDNVRINYRVLFLLWVVVIFAAAGLAYLEKTRKNKKSAAAATTGTPNKFLQTRGKVGNFSNVYKNKCIKKFKITLSEDLTTKVEAGFFGGYIQNEEYANEIVQAVYTSDDQLLGYISKKKEKLCSNIETLYDEPIICWGEIYWKEHKNSFCVKAYVPILYSEPEIGRFRKMVKLKEELLQMEQEPKIVELYSYLDKVENFYYLQQSEVSPSSLDHTVKPEILPELSRDLYDQKQWDSLVRLKKYPILISRIEQPEKKEVLNRIKKGEKRLSA